MAEPARAHVVVVVFRPVQLVVADHGFRVARLTDWAALDALEKRAVLDEMIEIDTQVVFVEILAKREAGATATVAMSEKGDARFRIKEIERAKHVLPALRIERRFRCDRPLRRRAPALDPSTPPCRHYRPALRGLHRPSKHLVYVHIFFNNEKDADRARPLDHRLYRDPT